jgi:hypothetical protein
MAYLQKSELRGNKFKGQPDERENIER